MKRLFALVIAIGIFVAAGVHVLPAAADSPGIVACGGTGEQACLLTFSPFVEKVIKTQGEITWCLNPRAAAYPNFRQQVAQVRAVQAEQLQVTQREVPYPADPRDTSCTVRDDMPDNHGCSGCGAWVYVSSYPMVIEYNWKAGYSLWQSTIGHEDGHGFCLLDEHYDKKGFRSFILTFGRWNNAENAPTVMDMGTWALSEYAPTGIWYFTDYDLDRCSETIGRDLKAPVSCGSGGVFWDACQNVWQFSAVACPITEGVACSWSPSPAPYGTWYGPDGVALWDGCDPRWNGRHTPLGEPGWYHAGQGFVPDRLGYWTYAPAC